MKVIRDLAVILFLLPFVVALVCVAHIAGWCGLLREVD